MAYTPFNADWKDYPDVTTPITEAALEHIETGITNAAATADAAIAETVVAAKGDLIVATANDTVTVLTVGADGTVLTAASGEATGMEWADPITEIEYTTITSDVTITGSTTTGTAVTVVTGTSRSYEAVPYQIDFYSPGLTAPGSPGAYVALYDGTTHVANLVHGLGAGGGTEVGACYGSIRITPTAATHEYGIKAYTGSSTAGTVQAGTGGGSGALAPGFLRIVKL